MMEGRFREGTRLLPQSCWSRDVPAYFPGQLNHSIVAYKTRRCGHCRLSRDVRSTTPYQRDSSYAKETDGIPVLHMGSDVETFGKHHLW